MKICSAAYLPPASFPGATAFHDNILRFKTRHDLVLFSENEWPEVKIKLKRSPEAPFNTIIKGKTLLRPPHKFAINNLLWFTALKMAREAGYSHLCYLESDCRVGRDGWDEQIFDEYFGLGRALVCGGTVAVYNPLGWNAKAARRWEQLVVTNAMLVQGKPYSDCRKNIPISTYGWTKANEKVEPIVFPNGALSIVSIGWMHTLFDLTQTAFILACNQRPFDMGLGVELGRRFQEDVYEVVGHLNCMYSGYGDVVTSPDERKALLTSGRYCAIHQIKDEWQP